jgi:KDO2-lipid IV(A) lauroyltransferase
VKPPVPSPQSPVPTFAHRAEYAAIRAIVGALGALDWRTAGDIGARIGAFGYRPLGIRRRVVERQIAAAFPDLDEEGVRRMARATYEHLGRSSIEAALLPKIGRAALLDMFEGTDNFELVEAAMANKRGLIFVSGHLGNWELAGAYVAARGYPIDGIARRMKNPLFDRYLTQSRSSLAIQVVHDADAVRRTPRSLREGRAVGFIADQGVGGRASA